MVVGFGRGDFLGMALSQEGKKHREVTEILWGQMVGDLVYTSRKQILKTKGERLMKILKHKS